MTAFPFQFFDTQGGKMIAGPPDTWSEGLSKREFFAAMAMMGLLSADVEYERSAATIAGLAVDQANALIEALEAKE